MFLRFHQRNRARVVNHESLGSYNVRGVRLLKGKEPIFQKIVFELRYRQGFSYLDKCGRMINAITENHPEWTLDPGKPNPQNAALISLSNSCVLHVGTRKLDLSLEIPAGGDTLEDDGLDEYADQVENTTAIIIDQLGLNEYDRIGCRVWYIFPCETQEESESWLNSLGCYSVSNNLVSAFGDSVEAAGLSVIVNGEDRDYRIAFNGVQRAAELDLGDAVLNVRPRDLDKKQQELLKHQEKTKARMRRAPSFPAMIDIDAYVEEPQSPEPKHFVTSTHGDILDRLRSAITE